MPALINWELISHPYNWLIVILMLAIGVWALCLIMGPARIGAGALGQALV